MTQKRQQDLLNRVVDWTNGHMEVSLAEKVAGEDLTNDVMKVEQQVLWQNMTATTNVKAGAGRLFGLFCASASGSPTVAIYNHPSSNSNVCINTFTPVAGTMYRFPAIVMSLGIRVVIAATCDITVFYQ